MHPSTERHEPWRTGLWYAARVASFREALSGRKIQPADVDGYQQAGKVGIEVRTAAVSSQLPGHPDTVTIDIVGNQFGDRDACVAIDVVIVPAQQEISAEEKVVNAGGGVEARRKLSPENPPSVAVLIPRDQFVHFDTVHCQQERRRQQGSDRTAGQESSKHLVRSRVGLVVHWHRANVLDLADDRAVFSNDR